MHLYLHVPFCLRRCSYCDFSIAIRKRIPGREYVEAIRQEMEMTGGVAGPLETIYFGGGTPSLLPCDAFATVLCDVSRSTPSLDGVEVTLEANPEDVTPDHAAAWRKGGVNRISLGAQSFDDRVLQWMHRVHDAARIGEAVRILRAAGIRNISLDLIFGLPSELNRNWARDLDAVCAIEPAHVSLYGLTVEERTPLARWISRGAITPPDEARYAEEYLVAHGRLGAAGYEFYEISNAARDGRRSRHNSAYWSGRAYRGLGPAAHSFDGRARRWNIAAWEAYRRAIAAGRSPVESEEVLTEEQRWLEQVYLGLRTIEGIPGTALYRPLPPITALVGRRWLVEEGGRVRCTPEGWLRLDSLVRDLTGGGVTA
ncbi:MAG: radical SAM family heme chaperone HemW [Gemmatimonadetes bacterium]|nr:radical SAM family heme chaperone HemW [Gemmatimonadota bacterium]